MSVFLGNGPSTQTTTNIYLQKRTGQKHWQNRLDEDDRKMWADAPPPRCWGLSQQITTLRCLRYHYTAAALVVSIKMLLSHLSWLHCKNISIKRAGHHNLPVDRWTQRISAWIVNVWAIWTNTMKSQRWPRLLIDCTVIVAAQDPFAQLHVWLTVGLQQH